MSIPPENIINRIKSSFDSSSELIIARAPGRINLIGEHTDYNKGLVLPAAIDKYCYIGLSPNNKNTITCKALDLDETYQFDLSNLTKTDKLWANFLIGLLLEFKKKGINLAGFDCVISSEVPIGAGMSSSSALECALLTCLNFFFDCNLSKWEMINMSQSSNHNFLGIQGGIMDQFASLFGRADKAILLDCNSLLHEEISLSQSAYKFLLINSCVNHNHLTSAYNDRVAECKQALKKINIKHPEYKSLGEINSVEDIHNVSFDSELKLKRAHFVIKENSRVRQFITELKNNNLIRCGELLYASHLGLTDEYEVSCPELDLLVALTQENPKVLGARMMGGGFGGCTINLIHKNAISDFKSIVKSKYQNTFEIEPKFYEVAISDAAEVLSV